MLEHIWSNLTAGVPLLLSLCIVGLAIEAIKPLEQQPAHHKIFNVLWLIQFLAVGNALMMVCAPLVGIGIEWLGGPWAIIKIPDSSIGIVVKFLLIHLWFDFFYYWFHRAQHRWAWFWVHHKLHHSDQSFNASTSFRHHWGENIYRIPMILIPMGLLKIEGPEAPIVWNLALIWSVFTHLNMRISLGLLTPIVAGPQWHRLHHSAVLEHHNHNFSAYFPIYDIIFGTYLRPEKNTTYPCGLPNGEHIDRHFQAHTYVFKEWYAMIFARLRGAAGTVNQK